MTTQVSSASPLDIPVREQAVENLSAQIVSSQDDIIASAITATIGEGWILSSLTGRLVRKIYPDKIEVIALDGKDILELHPMTFEQVTEGGAIKLKAVQKYRLLPNAVGKPTPD